ncbi:MAG: anthrone oxygenase family protein [Ornithinimicrobium sp.]
MINSLTTVRVAGVTAAVFAAAIFGFFYAWVCSTMWGLDEADPRVAIEAMQAMNASVRNATFFPAFFGTPLVIALAAGLAWRHGLRRSAGLWASAAAVYLAGGLVLTMMLNVPMNEALALQSVPTDIDAARAIWTDYSAEWQVYNIIRTVASGIAVALVALGLLHTGPCKGGGADYSSTKTSGSTGSTTRSMSAKA